MADQPTTREADPPRPTTVDRAALKNGEAATNASSSFDPRDAEIAHLRRERDEWRARERMARAEVGQLHERLTLLAQMSKRFATSMRGGTSERQRYRRRIAAQYAVSRTLAQARDLKEAAPEIMQILGERLGWQTGALWTLSEGELRYESFWRSRASSPGSFEEACRRTGFSRGVGLPGRAWAEGESVYSENLLEEDDPLREAAAEAGLRGAIAFPVRDGGLVGVFELFRTEDVTPSEELLQTTALVGRQVGQFVERRQAEMQRDSALMRERRARQDLTNILESISDAFFALDREWRLTYVNQKAEQFWDRRRNELLGKNILGELPQEIGSEQYRAIRCALEEGVTISFEEISPVVKVWVAGRVYPSPRGVSVYFQDITERKKAETELLALKDELDAELSEMSRLHELSTRLLASTELHPVLEEVLDASIKLQGADFGNIQLYDQKTGELEIVAHRGFEQEFLDYFSHTDENATCGRAINKGERVVIEDVEKDAQYEPHRQIAASAGYRAVQSTPLIDHKGEPLGVLSTHFREPHRPSERELRMTDLYARQAAEMIGGKLAEERLRRSEERLRLAIKIDTVGVIFFRTDGSITDANEAFLRMSGYSREDLAQGLLRWDEMTPPEWMTHSVKAIEELESTGRTTPYEKEYIRKDGSRWWALCAATRLGEGEGVEFAIDITERKRAGEERERLLAQEWTARAQAEERRRLSRDLHDRVAHDMALVHQCLELYEALKTNDPDKAATKMKLARETVKRALESTRNLSMELRQQEVRRSLEAALSDLLREVVPPSITFELSVDGDETPVPAEARSQVFLILREAIRNAVTHSGCSRITVRSETLQEVITGCVEDDGRGFDAEAFRPADRNGLRSMEERAKLLGGTLEVSSAPGRGTMVRVTIPLGRSDGG